MNINNQIKSRTQFTRLFEVSPFTFETGEQIKNIEVAFQTYGKLNSEGDNSILICHALTGNSHAAGIIDSEEIENSTGYEFLQKYNNIYSGKAGWWDPLIGPGKVFDTDKYFVVCVNILGSCYGTSGPASINPATGKEFKLTFPEVTVRDMVNVEKELIDNLGINKLVTVAGGSLGGMQALEWGAMYPEKLQSIIPIATVTAHPPWAIGLNKIATKAIKNDPAWNNGNYTVQPRNGLSLAREAAMISYRTPQSFDSKFGRQRMDSSETFAVQSYLDYQGDKLVNRFDANTYLYLAEAMDTHDIGRNRGEIKDVLKRFDFPVLSIGINSDLLYPTYEQKLIAENTPHGEYGEIKSIHGHDAFLIEFEQLENIITKFMANL